MSSSSHDSARLAPVIRRANCLVVSEDANRLHGRFPQQAEALGRLWGQEPTSALSMLSAAAWDTALTSGFLLDSPRIEAAVACLLTQDLKGYEQALFRAVPAPKGPGAYVDDGSDAHPGLAGDSVLADYHSKLAAVRRDLAKATGDEATELSATYAHRLLKLRQRRRELLESKAAQPSRAMNLEVDLDDE